MSTFDRYVDIDGVSLSCPAWEVTNIETLLSGAATRGTSRVIPGVPGRRPKPRRADETPYTLNLAIFGDRDPDGGTHSDAETGLLINIAALREFVTDPIAGDGTRLLTLHWKADFTLTATIQVVHFEVLDHLSPSAVEASIEITSLDGALAIEVVS